ncbi:MAG: SpoIIE family protein phosphatase [Bacteroidota bacterium]|nr:SpoIIE family protein phosphatase [Bacteroidota bacterium]
MRFRNAIIVLFLFGCSTFFSQSSKSFEKNRDSIMALPDDSVKVELLMNLFKNSVDSDFIGSMGLIQNVVTLTYKIKKLKTLARFYNNVGDQHFNKANYDESYRYYYTAYELSDSIGSKFHVALSAYNLGWQTAIQQRNYKDVSYLYKALRIGKEINSDAIILRVENALGSFYTDKYDREDKRPDFDSAVKYFTDAIEKTKSLKRFRQTAALYLNLGQLFYHSKDYTSSVFYYEKAKNTFKDDSNNVISCLIKITLCDEKVGKIKDPSGIYKFIYGYATRNDLREMRKESLQILMEYYYNAGRFKEAFDTQKEFHLRSNELNGEYNEFSIKNLETNYKYAKSEASNIQLKQANEIQELKGKRKTIYITLLGGVGLIILIVAYLLFRQNKIKQTTNLQLQEQNKIISEKKLEIEQSIEYAKGIQTAFLPSKEELDLLIKENFIFYKPKDVVSGDFYWYLINENQNGLLLACADCTGHGVPGALMSMVGINILQQLTVERKMQSPGLILKYLNAEIKNSLKQNSDQSIQRDGMDVSIIHLDLVSKILTYAGANRPLYLVRDSEVVEYKATKHAIGGFTKYDQTFDEVKIDLKKDDLICLTTDGYADQFGGPEAKKFMTKNLKAVLAKTHHLSAKDQLEQLETVFNNWKGRHEQIDDVCLVGIRV